MEKVPKHPSHCGKTTKRRGKRRGKQYSDCVRVLNTQKKPRQGKTHCSWCHKYHKCRLLFQSKQGYDHCCSVECIVMVKQYHGYTKDEQEETSEPLLMLCPNCNVTIDTTKVKLCAKCVKAYPPESWSAYGY